MITKQLAKEIADIIGAKAEWFAVRDFVDLKTSGALDSFQLDMLTDWVMAFVRQKVAA